MDIGLLIIHLYLGVNFLAYGGQKVFGMFDGPGLQGYSKWVGSLGFRPAKAMGYLGAFTELFAGLFMLLGFLTPLASAAIVGQMIVAGTAVHLKNGYFNSQGGVTYNLSLIAAALGLAFTGPGEYSLDAALGWELHGVTWGLIALGLGVVTAAIVLALRDRQPAETA